MKRTGSPDPALERLKRSTTRSGMGQDETRGSAAVERAWNVCKGEYTSRGTLLLYSIGKSLTFLSVCSASLRALIIVARLGPSKEPLAARLMAAPASASTNGMSYSSQPSF